jgi:integrase
MNIAQPENKDQAQTTGSASMSQNMKLAPRLKNVSKPKGKPWRTVKGKHRSIAIYRWGSEKRYVYQIREGSEALKTTTNQQNIVDFATILADTPPQIAPSLADLPTDLLVETVNAITKLQPALHGIQMSVPSGIEEYAYIRAKAGKLALRDLMDSLLSSGLADDQLRDAVGALAKLAPILAPFEISVASGIEEYAAVKQRAGQSDLRQLFEKLLNTPWLEKSKTGILEVAKAFLKERKEESRVSFEYHKGLYYTLSKLMEHVGQGTAIGAVNQEQLTKIISDPHRAARSNKAYRGHLVTFFNWCKANKYLDYTQPTVAEALPAIQAPDPHPRILTVPEARAMLTAIDDPWCLLFLAMGLFTGIRHDELQRLEFHDIKGGENVIIPPSKSKTKKARTIPIQAVLGAWLAPFYGRGGLVIPITSVQLKVRRLLSKVHEAGVPQKWSRNWLRQSYASYRLAQCRDPYTTAQEDGHYVYVLERVYKGLSTREAAEEYFELTPKACGKPKWFETTRLFLADEPELKGRPVIDPDNWKELGTKVTPRKPSKPDHSQPELQLKAA